MPVSRDDLGASFEALRRAVPNPEHGIHGPGSVSWRLNGEALVFLGAGRAVLLQLAHPYVATAIDDHSNTRADARKRFLATFEFVFDMVFGDLEQAIRAATRVHAIHSRIRGRLRENVGRYRIGDRYEANDPDALLWVQSTLIDTVLTVHDWIGSRATEVDRDAYLREASRFSRLFGIPEERVPSSGVAHRRYMDEMLSSSSLGVTAPAREMADFILTPPALALRPLMAWYRVMTAALLPERLRVGFGLRYGRSERRLARTSAAVIRRAWPRMPASMRQLPGHARAMERLGLDRASLGNRAFERLLIGGLGLWAPAQ